MQLNYSGVSFNEPACGDGKKLFRRNSGGKLKNGARGINTVVMYIE
jgi:hypothetical protein